MKVRVIALFAAVLFSVVSTSAEARHQHHRAHHQATHVAALPIVAPCIYDNSGRVTCQGAADRALRPATTKHSYAFRDVSIVAHPVGCPRVAFCGCGVSVWAFGASRRDLWPAAAYYRFARDVAAAGNVAVWRHHVAGIIAINADGTAQVYDPNSGGHQTRIHTRSLSGATIVNPHRARYASLR